MSLQTLPPDQRAVLQLLLQKDRSYDEIAQLLRLDGQTIRARAHAAVDAVGPLSRDLSEDQRGELTDYLLGEQTASARAATRAFLEGSRAARAWARDTAEALRPLGGDRLPQIPADLPGAAAPAAAPAPAPEPRRSAPTPVAPPPAPEPEHHAEPEPEPEPEPDPEPAPRPIPTLPRTAAERPEPIADAVDAPPPAERGTGSRLGSMLLVFGAAAVLAVVLIVGLRALGGDDENTTSGGGGVAEQPAPQTAATPPAKTTRSTSTQATSKTTATTPSVNAEIRMRPPSGGEARATVTLITQSGKESIALAGSKLKPTTDKAFYGLWFANSKSDALFLGYAPQVGANGRMRLFDSLPGTGDPSQYQEIWLTREIVGANTKTPTSPGEIALSGALTG